MPNRVLVVDDSLLMRKMISDCLIANGWEIAGEAADGRDAVEKYRRLRPDAVTLDIVMPGADGMYALQHILGMDRDAKIVVVSALNQTKTISEAIRKGAQDFIAKPFFPDQLQETMRNYLTEPAGAV
jgi:two-component system, chemotaxis family, chemotaxis protein CheY